jgi:hypothetical protein
VNPNDPRLDALQRYADGTATREDVAVLERAIIDDPDFRDLAVEYLHLDSAMEEFATVDAVPLAGGCEINGEKRIEPANHSNDTNEDSCDSRALLSNSARPIRWLRWALAAAASAAVMGLTLWHWWPVKSEVAQVEVEVLQLANVTVAAPQSGMHVHDRIRLGLLDLRSGEARLRLPSKVELAVSGPVELRFTDPMHARVLHGKVTVDCAAGGPGFVLDTPVTRVVDVSTQFGADARADGTTDVMVIKGRVKLENPRQAQQPATLLEQGEAVRVDAKQTFTRILNITGSPQSGEWSTQPPTSDCQIVSVTDNFGATEGFHFYRIVPHGLRPGAAVYTSRTYVWRAADGREFPESLMNADVVQTFFGDLKRPSYAIEVEVARPVELFILMPRRGIPQSWLTENFTPTGEELMLEENGAPTHAPSHVPFEVWKRAIPQAGTVTLGPSNRDGSGGPVGMYGIAAKALPL